VDQVTPGYKALTPLLDRFLSESCGDVVPARRCAKAMLAGFEAPAPVASAALLLLTATCVYLQGQVGPDPELSDILRTLAQLRPGLSGQAKFAASPMPFLQYVAAEVADGIAAGAIDLAIRAVSEGL
jgi:hypothetical protein